MTAVAEPPLVNHAPATSGSFRAVGTRFTKCKSEHHEPRPIHYLSSTYRGWLSLHSTRWPLTRTWQKTGSASNWMQLISSFRTIPGCLTTSLRPMNSYFQIHSVIGHGLVLSTLTTRYVKRNPMNGMSRSMRSAPKANELSLPATLVRLTTTFLFVSLTI